MFHGHDAFSNKLSTNNLDDDFDAKPNIAYKEHNPLVWEDVIKLLGRVKSGFLMQDTQVRNTKVEFDPERADDTHLNFPTILSPNRLRDRAQNIFDEMDADENGLLSKAEVRNATEHNLYTAGDAHIIENLFYGNAFKELANLSDDQKGKETHVSMNDIDRLGSNNAAEIGRYLL